MPYWWGWTIGLAMAICDEDYLRDWLENLQ